MSAAGTGAEAARGADGGGQGALRSADGAGRGRGREGPIPADRDGAGRGQWMAAWGVLQILGDLEIRIM